jgi:hypothetical protein
MLVQYLDLGLGGWSNHIMALAKKKLQMIDNLECAAKINTQMS